MVEASGSSPKQQERINFRVNTEPIRGTIKFAPGTIWSNTGDIRLRILPPDQDKSGTLKIWINSGTTELLVEDPETLVNVIRSRDLNISGTPPQQSSRIISIESNSSRGVQIYYPDSPTNEELQKIFAAEAPNVSEGTQEGRRSTFGRDYPQGRRLSGGRTPHGGRDETVEVITTLATGNPVIGITAGDLLGEEE